MDENENKDETPKNDIKIPFSPPMAKASLYGNKTCTSRNKKCGESGDYFLISGWSCELLAVVKRPLWFVRDNLYGQEGFDKPQGFEETWVELHPRKKFDPDQEVWVHWFCIHGGPTKGDD